MASGAVMVSDNLVCSFTANAVALVTVPVTVLADAVRFVAHAATDILSFIEVALGIVYPVRGPPVAATIQNSCPSDATGALSRLGGGV